MAATKTDAQEAINIATYALRHIEAIIEKRDLGLTDYSAMSDEGRFGEIEDEVASTLISINSLGFDTRHNL